MGGVVRAIGDIVEGIVGAVVGIVQSVVSFVGDVVGFLFSPFGAFDVPTGATDQPDRVAGGVTVTKNGTNVAIPVVYGFRRIGGSLIFAESHGPRNEYLVCVYALCEGEIEGIKRIFIDDTQLPLPTQSETIAAGRNQTYKGVSGVPGGDDSAKGIYHLENFSQDSRYAELVKFQISNGTETGLNSALANGDYIPGGITTSWNAKRRRLPGVAYIVMQFKYPNLTIDSNPSQEEIDANPFKGGLPQVKFDVLGKKVYDIKTATAGVENVVDSYANLTKRYTTCPSSCLLDYLMNPRYGCGLGPSDINAEAFRRAGEKLNTDILYYKESGQEFRGPAMTMNTVVDTNNKLMDNVKLLVGGNRGILPYIKGRYKLKVEDAGSDSDDITSSTVNIAYQVNSDHIIGGITLDGERKNTKFNEVIINFVDPDKEFTNQQVVYNVASDKTNDNEKLVKEFTFHTVTNYSIAEKMAIIIYKKSRQQKTISFKATQELLDVEVGDIIDITDSILNYTNKQFRVVDLKLSPDLTVNVSAVEHDTAFYPLAEGTPYIVAPQVFAPDEIALNPRVRALPTYPIGIVPPDDEDSAGAITNPLPIQPDGVVRAITSFEANPPERVGNNVINQLEIDPVNGGYIADGWRPVVFSSTSGWAQHNPAHPKIKSAYDIKYPDGVNSARVGSTKVSGTPILFWDDTLMYTQNILGCFLAPGLPKLTGLYGVNFKFYDENAQEIDSKSFSALPGHNFFIEFSYTSGKTTNRIRYVKVNWLKWTDRNIYVPDGSDLGTTYTYYDPKTKRNTSGRNLEAYLNYILVDPKSRLGNYIGSADPNNPIFSTSVDLSGG